MGKKKSKNNQSNIKNNKNTVKVDQNKEIKKEKETDVKKEYEIKKVIPVLEFSSLDGKVKPKKEKEKSKVEEENENKLEDNNKKEEKNDIQKESVKEDKEEVKSANIYDQIQSFVSILFTIIIFLAIILLIFILYNNYFKKKDINLDKVCSDYIEKDYGITKEMVENFVKNGRAIIYNYDKFSKKNLTNDDLIKFASFFIWSQDVEYSVCDDSDEKCLVSKMEMDINTLNANFKNYLDIDDINIKYNTEYNEDDKTRLYKEGNKVVLTFSEFEYQTLTHNIVDIDIKEDKVYVTFALEELVPNTNIYKYAGYKTLELKYHDNNFSIENIKTSLKK